MMLAEVALAWALLTQALPAAGLTFTGNLRFVSTSAITIRLSNGVVVVARLPAKGDLTAAKIAAQYKFADQVQVTFKGVGGSWDESVKRYHSLEPTAIRFDRAGSPEEIAKVSAALFGQDGENLLHPPDAPKPPPVRDPEGLERERSVNLARAERMPSFVADEIATGFHRGKKEFDWKKQDTIESEIFFKGRDAATRDHIRITANPIPLKPAGCPGSIGA